MSRRPLSILYRGDLSSCNYDCAYCPFAKRRDPADVLEKDERDLQRFVAWALEQDQFELSVLFTPWGEALTRRWYRDAMLELSSCAHVARVAAQTNLSCGLDWLEAADRDTLALWCTYHPGQVAKDRYVSKMRQLQQMGIRCSAGMVGFPEHLDEAKQLRSELPADIYLWVNEPEELKGTLTPDDIAEWSAIDPLFHHNTVAYESQGQACRTGDSVISLAGDGTVRRCHFVPTPLGNLYHQDLADLLRPRPCPKEICDCHIGYVHLDGLNLDQVFGAGLLERIPATHIW